MWAGAEEHKAKVTASLKVIRSCVEGGKCCVAFSGGKDSTVMLHLALSVDPEIDVFHWDQGSRLMPRDIFNEILANAKAIGVRNLIVESWRGSEAMDMQTNPKRWRSAHLFHYLILNKVRKERGWAYQFVGLRSEEGCKRSVVVKRPRAGEAYPVGDWTWLDVWGYIVSHGLPYPKMYDLYCPLLGWDRARFVNFFSMRFENFGSPYVDGFLLPGKRHSS